MSPPKPATVEAKLEKFARLPDDAIIDDAVVAALMNISPETFRRSARLQELMPRRQFSKRRGGRRKGDVVAVIRGEAA
jgi:hypothetical protein